jgi:hypothetical protein
VAAVSKGFCGVYILGGVGGIISWLKADDIYEQ